MSLLQQTLIALSNKKIPFIYDVHDDEAVVSFDCRAMFDIDEFYESKNGSLVLRMKHGKSELANNIDDLKKFTPFRHE